jgi:hypothetical protein
MAWEKVRLSMVSPAQVLILFLEILIQVDFFTPVKKIRLLETKLNEFLASHPREYSGRMDLQLAEVENSNRLNISMWLQHKSNWQDFGGKINRRNQVLLQSKIVALVQD